MKKLAFLYIIIAGVLWGTSGIFVHLLSPFGFFSVQMTFFRVLISFLLMLIYLLIYNKKLLKVRAKELLLFAASGIALFGTSSCYYASMQATSISTAVMLMYTAPILVMIYSVAFLGEKFTKSKALSVLCMLIGCGLVSGIIGGLKFNFWGIALGLLSGISYSVYNILTKIEMRRGSNPMSATLYCFLFVTVVSFFACKPAELVGLVAQKPLVILPLILGLGVCTCVLPYFLYTLALKELPAGTASALGVIEPMSATVFSILLFHEPLELSSICGIVLILTAVFILSRNEY